MTSAELKIELINRITKIEEVQKFLDFELDSEVFQLSEKQRQRILEARADTTLSEEQANKEIEEWLRV